jgi:hypothetical protein
MKNGPSPGHGGILNAEMAELVDLPDGRQARTTQNRVPSGVWACLPIGRFDSHFRNRGEGGERDGRMELDENKKTFFVYALKSVSRNYIYVGLTDNIERRTGEHNNGKSKTTRPYAPICFNPDRRISVKN